MVKETVTYTDYDGNERTEDFYFNLTKAELAELNLSVKGGWANALQKAANERDIPEVTKQFKNLLLKSYGRKSPDGRRFEKSEEITNDFLQTEAYSVLFMKYASDANAAAAFFKGVVPKDIAEKAGTEMDKLAAKA